MRQTPQRVVVHKTSRYWPTEEKGFTSFLRQKVSQYDLLALSPQSTIRLMPVSFIRL